MDYAVFVFISGMAFFLGIAIVVCAAVVLALSRWSLPKRIAGPILLVGVCFVALSAVPVPGWAYAVWACAVGAELVVYHRAPDRATPSRVALVGVLAVSAALVGLEIPYHLGRHVAYPDHGVIYVVGDSLSMGADTLEQNWPQRLGTLAGLPTQNLGFGGATVASALSNAKRIQGDAALVILEIGGNDLLGGTPAAKFEDDLRTMLEVVCLEDRAVLMIELPLPPTYNRFGSIQRRLAREYGVQLVPRRVLARVLTTSGATTDGLHLSNEGHELLADALWSLRD